MKTIIFIFTCAIFFSCSDNTFKNDFLPFELRLATTEQLPNLKEMNFYNTDQTFFVYDFVFLKNDDITSTEILDWPTHPKVKVILNDQGRDKFAAFTLKNIGKNAAIVVNHHLVSAPKINSQIKDGILLIVGFFNHEEAQNLADGIISKN